MLLSIVRTTWHGAHYLCLLALLTLAFDVGKECGLDYSMWLVSWYIVTFILRRFFSQGTIKVMVKSILVLEPLFVIGLLGLSIFMSNKGTSNLIWIWEAIIKGSDPVLTVLEGFGTILIIQKSSQVVRRLAAKSDGYQIGFLILSASVYVTAGFGLYQLYVASSPELVPSVRSASIIGCCMTLTIVLSVIALISGRGVITDTAFLFAYMVMTMYIAARNEAIENGPFKSKIMPLHSAVQFGPLSIPYLQSLSPQDMERIAIQTFVHLSQLLQVLIKALSPNLLIGLLYRMGVLIAVSHIAPSLNISSESQFVSSPRLTRKSSQEHTLSDDDEGNSRGVMSFLASSAKPVLLMTHTRILLQYFGYLKPSLAIWGWLNSFLCLTLFAAELVLARDDAWEQYGRD